MKYTFRCQDCGRNIAVEAKMGDAPAVVQCAPPTGCEGYATRVFAMPFIGAGALPNKRHGARADIAREDRWARDMPAYHRLRMDGLQPPKIDGSGDLEQQANIQFEIETGKLFPKEEHSRIREGMALTRDLENEPGVAPEEWHANAREALKKQSEKTK